MQTPIPTAKLSAMLDTNLSGKEMARIPLKGGRVLSIPVEGGGAQLKHRSANPFAITLSNHGKWRQEHLATFAALYGKTPFFPHLYPRIEEVYRNSEGISLGEFRERLNGIATDFLEYDSIRDSLDCMQRLHPGRFEMIQQEIAEKVDPSLSIFDAIFRLGKTAVFAIAAPRH